MTVAIQGLNHIGLIVEDIGRAKDWFAGALGLRIIEDRGELVFLLAGNDVIAIKTPRMAVSKPEHGAESDIDYKQRAGWQSLDHYGFFAPSPQDVDRFAAHIVNHGAKFSKVPMIDATDVVFISATQSDSLGNISTSSHRPVRSHLSRRVARVS